MKPFKRLLKPCFISLIFLSCQPSIASNPTTQEYIVVFKNNPAHSNKATSFLNSLFRLDNESLSETAARLITLAQQNQILTSLEDPINKAKALQIINKYEHALKGFSAHLTPEAVRYLKMFSEVDMIVPDIKVQLNAIQMDPPSWGLDRIDQTDLPLDSSYEYTYDGTGVHLYIIDTGIKKNHTEFTGRVANGIDFVEYDTKPQDCNGHGTHVAAIAAGTTYGVAKNATIHPVRVFGCEDSTSLSTILSGIEWTMTHAQKPAVANLSFGSSAFPLIDIAVRTMVQSGISVVVAAGNESQDACNRSPARVVSAITVASSTPFDEESYFTNYGSCVDLYAPGSAIISAGIDSNHSFSIKSGTSMASPHVAGAAALILQEHPYYLPVQVERTLIAHAAKDKILDAGDETANLLLMVR